MPYSDIVYRAPAYYTADQILSPTIDVNLVANVPAKQGPAGYNPGFN